MSYLHFLQSAIIYKICGRSMSIGYSITAIIVDFKNRFVNKSKQTCNLNKTFYLPKKKVDGAGFGVGSSQVSDYDSFQPESGDQETHEDNRKHQPDFIIFFIIF